VYDNIGNCSSVLSHVYTLVRSSKQQRRLFLTALLRHFEDYEASLDFEGEEFILHWSR